MTHTINFLSLLKNKEIQEQAEKNFKLKKPINKFKLLVENKDWGTVTKELTIKYGQKFAVLNMANSQTFGGGFLNAPHPKADNTTYLIFLSINVVNCVRIRFLVIERLNGLFSGSFKLIAAALNS